VPGPNDVSNPTPSAKVLSQFCAIAKVVIEENILRMADKLSVFEKGCDCLFVPWVFSVHDD